MLERRRVSIYLKQEVWTVSLLWYGPFLPSCDATRRSCLLDCQPQVCSISSPSGAQFQRSIDGRPAFERELWEAVDQLRANSKLTASEYAMPVRGLIFLRHAYNRFSPSAVRGLRSGRDQPQSERGLRAHLHGGMWVREGGFITEGLPMSVVQNSEKSAHYFETRFMWGWKG
ncbi:type I restriction-modification system subunit M N-terminal domain-containing protein [Pseudomonas linyingensis]|uniref:type I restriction-modification system subunit M N-terminal domain-containing protein n=1 Tax=Pseudomonas linyingensis TaxID=915471 RepID=UPI000B7CA0E4|nr:type I restriction-modification system subunit M N-terminal domain-containing protein [Pseudomonas linyingensis]